MNIKSYIKNIRFNAYQLFFRENKNFETYFLDVGEESKLMDSSNGVEIQNGISAESIPSSFTLIEEQNDTEFISSLISNEQLNYFPNRKDTIYDSGIVFYLDDKIVAYLNISLKEKISRNEDGYPVDLSLEFVDKLASKFKEAGVQVFKNYLPPSIAVLEQWRLYKFPFDFYKNPVFEIFESSTNSGLFAINWNIVKLDIVPVNNSVKPEQIQKALFLEENRAKLRQQLLDEFWHQYIQWKDEYELPTLDQKEQLYGLIELSSITVENDPEFTVQLYFRTWDDEHGQYVRINKNNQVEFV